jgi:cyclic pyranopterin phosphate synthase
MVDVGDKKISTRSATARTKVWVPESVMRLVSADGEMRSAKGPVFATAIVAGSMAAKKTHDLIPFCHPLGLESCKFQVKVDGPNDIVIECTVRVTGKTGVEMEALTGAR